ncbi:MAG: sigma-54-dependent Fis family transcriptional regulator [Gammaproteobacteria bacterium]|nr:MAG: sigma-54-dependent Fis family transcriptional regulator [Gammaproteobacteria bacterium]
MGNQLMRVLVVEDDLNLREALVDTLALSGYHCYEAENGEVAMGLIRKHDLDLVISDVNMPLMGGDELLKKIRQTLPLLPVLLITAYGSISDAVRAIRCGAVDYLTKPFDASLLVDKVKELMSVMGGQDSIIAEDAKSRELLRLSRRIAQSSTSVMILGESGTGKEVVARYIHEHSNRADKTFVAINCAAIPETMLEATLFGFEKGAFTGACQACEGKFEQANGGTLLLDEITEMDLALQAKILRVLQEREVERLGGKKIIKLDVRIIATSNRNLKQCVLDGRLREDLFYRLNVLPLEWMPLRERRGDIIPLAKFFLSKHHENSSPLLRLSPMAQNLLLKYHWPGNVRELENVMQRALVMCQGELIEAQDLMIDLGGANSASIKPELGIARSTDDSARDLGEDLKHHEYQVILDALQSVNGRRNKAAEILGISARTLRYKIAKMRDNGINVDEYARIA